VKKIGIEKMTIEVAPGARILCRDAEWLVKSVSLTSDGDKVIEAVGVSEFLRGKRVQFLEELEGHISILQPEKTQLVQDSSPNYFNALLFVEANLKQVIPQDDKIYIGNRGAMDTLKYQLYPTSLALKMPRQRILIADAVGLGKTLECGMLVSELILRERGRRILVVTTKSMISQFQKEFWLRFTIPLVPLDSFEIQRIKSIIPTNYNPFFFYDRTIISVDTLKQDREYSRFLERSHWDIIIIDEAHNVAERGNNVSKRSKLADKLSTLSDTLILLSATPHDGKSESFASLMNMLDPTAIANESEYTKDDIRNLYVRRFKKDVWQDLRENMLPEPNIKQVESMASQEEELVFEVLNNLRLVGIDKNQKAGHLFKTTLLKSFLSSPQACKKTVDNRLRSLEKKREQLQGGSLSEVMEDIGELTVLAGCLDPILQDVSKFSKYQELLRLIKEDFSWQGDSNDRLVIFTSRLETLNFLCEQLARDLRLGKDAICYLKGEGMNDTEQMKVVEKFGQENDAVRVLVATEVAAEGINLHYLSHRLIHFDIPWSLMTVQQRNGRVDRYGQKQRPEIRYLITRCSLPEMDESNRIIKVLLKKNDQAIKNIGDPSIFLGKYDANQEDDYVSSHIEMGTSAEKFEEILDGNAQKGGDLGIFSWMEESHFDEVFSGDDNAEIVSESTGTLLSLFNSTFDFVVSALESNIVNIPNLQINYESRFIELEMPTELKTRYQRLPRELAPDNKTLLFLTDDREVIMDEIAIARKREGGWTKKQYLWELHPLVEWLKDRCLFHFPRHQAPVIQLHYGVDADESIFICFGSFSNRRGYPIINCQLSVIFKGNKFSQIEVFAETVKRLKLGEKISNTGSVELESLLPLREEAIKRTKRYLSKMRQEEQQKLNVKLGEEKRRLEGLRDNHLNQLQLWLQKTEGEKIKQQGEKRRGEIDKMFESYEEWVEFSMTTESEPYIKLVAVLRG
jgi:ERCC4-related helicase